MLDDSRFAGGGRGLGVRVLGMEFLRRSPPGSYPWSSSSQILPVVYRAIIFALFSPPPPSSRGLGGVHFREKSQMYRYEGVPIPTPILIQWSPNKHGSHTAWKEERTKPTRFDSSFISRMMLLFETANTKQIKFMYNAFHI